MTSGTDATRLAKRQSILTPKGLLLSILLQMPLLIFRWPLAPTSSELFIGGTLALAGIVLNLWADQLFKRGGVGLCPFSPTLRLVSTGPFKVTRNPMYLGFIFLSASFAFFTGALVNLWAPLALLGWLHFRFVLPEEAFLLEQLGQTYESYRSSHPRWIGITLTWYQTHFK